MKIPHATARCDIAKNLEKKKRVEAVKLNKIMFLKKFES